MQGVLSAAEKHICIIDDAGNVATICGHRWLQQPVPAGDQTPRCDDCHKIDLSGEEIAATDADGMKVVIRPKIDPAHIGSVDPFEDTVEQLKKLRCAYLLVVAMQGQPRTHYWTNLADYGPRAVEGFRTAAGNALDHAQKIIDGKAV